MLGAAKMREPRFPRSSAGNYARATPRLPRNVHSVNRPLIAARPIEPRRGVIALPNEPLGDVPLLHLTPVGRIFVVAIGVGQVFHAIWTLGLLRTSVEIVDLLVGDGRSEPLAILA